MKYIAHGTGGDPDCMRLTEGPAPQPGPGQILIEVVCAGVNRPAVLQRSGRYPPPPDASPVLGLEVAGRVAALGTGVTEWKVGDGVTALTPGGGYAEYVVAPVGQCMPIPTGFSKGEAAALPEALLRSGLATHPSPSWALAFTNNSTWSTPTLTGWV